MSLIAANIKQNVLLNINKQIQLQNLWNPCHIPINQNPFHYNVSQKIIVYQIDCHTISFTNTNHDNYFNINLTNAKIFNFTQCDNYLVLLTNNKPQKVIIFNIESIINTKDMMDQEEDFYNISEVEIFEIKKEIEFKE